MDKNAETEKFFDKQKYLEAIVPLLQQYLRAEDYKSSYFLLVNMIPKIAPISKDFVDKLIYKKDDSS